MPVYITRPAGGISLNAGIREYLLDNNDNPIKFGSINAAELYLLLFGFTDDDMTGIEFPENGPQEEETPTG